MILPKVIYAALASLVLALIIVAGYGLPVAYQLGKIRQEADMACQIRKFGFYDDRGWQAVMFPLKSYSGKQEGIDMRVYVVPDEEGTYRFEIHTIGMSIEHKFKLTEGVIE